MTLNNYDIQAVPVAVVVVSGVFVVFWLLSTECTTLYWFLSSACWELPIETGFL